jgi:segregation and condensation protein B
MSLKAKLEAVIYAAEEPVTLTQLASLFASEALEWKAEQAAVCVETDAAAESLSLIPDELGYPEPDQASDSASPESIPSSENPESEAVSAEEQSAPSESSVEISEEPSADPAPSVEDPLDPEQEARRLARLRDREVRSVLRQLLNELIDAYAADGRGIEIREIAGGYRMATKPECHDAVRSFVKSLKPALKLSLPALETLAVIAYKQPVTAPEVNEIRGVDSSGVFGSLLARKLIATAGRKQVIGRPILYKTTREFLLRFGLKDVNELPSMEEFERLAATELDEPELESARSRASSLQLELIATEPQDTVGEETADDSLDSSPELAQDHKTAATADSSEPATPEEAAPAEPSLPTQAETENIPYGEEISKEH